MSVVPPARKCPIPSAPPFCAASIAFQGVSAESNMKGRMALSSSTHAELGLFHGRDNVGIGPAAADIPTHVFADRWVTCSMPFIHTADGRHDLSRCAIAALKRVMVDEGLLHRMQLAVWTGDPFDRCDRVTLDTCRESEA